MRFYTDRYLPHPEPAPPTEPDEEAGPTDDQDRARWKEQWPNHCPRCEGSTDCENPCVGLVNGDARELRPIGSCERGCLFQLWCPRCGRPGAMDPENAAIPCRFCAYREGRHEYDGLPNLGYDGCPPEPDATHTPEPQAGYPARLTDRLGETLREVLLWTYAHREPVPEALRRQALAVLDEWDPFSGLNSAGSAPVLEKLVGGG